MKNYGALALHKAFGRASDVNAMYETMRAYWTAVRETFQMRGAYVTESRLMLCRIQAMGVLMDRLVQRVERDQNFQQNIQTALKRIKLIVPGLRVNGQAWNG